jgi:hypothetical protein
MLRQPVNNAPGNRLVDAVDKLYPQLRPVVENVDELATHLVFDRVVPWMLK